MQESRFVWRIIRITVLVLIGLSLVKLIQSPQFNELKFTLQNRCEIFYRNLKDSVFPARRTPINTIEFETRLKLSFPVPFTSFRQNDWEWFWHLLFGNFAVDADGWKGRRRQLTREEIEDTLKDSYPNPFAYFNQQQWNMLWNQVLKGRVFGK